MRRSILIAAGALGAASLTAGGAALASSRGDEQPLTGATLEQATAAALRATNGGVVTETEIGDDGAAYGVEVRLPDGRQVEIGLDERFAAVGREVDDDGAEEETERND